MDDWKFLDARQCDIGGVPCLAIRISYTGELGWELYPAMEDMGSVYSEIIDKGGDLGLGHVGTRVINTLRIEKGEKIQGLSQRRSENNGLLLPKYESEGLPDPTGGSTDVVHLLI